MLAPAMVLLALLTALAGWRARAAATGARRLVSLALVSSACLLNPYGAKALRLPFDQLFLHLEGRRCCRAPSRSSGRRYRVIS